MRRLKLAVGIGILLCWGVEATFAQNNLGNKSTIAKITIQTNFQTCNPTDSIFPTNVTISTKNVAPLNVGDQVPDVYLGEILNFPGLNQAKISDFKGKLLILDFWSIWCSSCIKQFPKLTEIQKKIGDDVVILPVGFDGAKEGITKDFLSKNKGTPNELKLPSVIQKPTDTVLMQLFPFTGLPHEIWIDKDGTVIGITDAFTVTEENIRRVLRGDKIIFPTEKPRRMISWNEPFLINRNKQTKTFGSAFALYVDSIRSIDIFGAQYDSTILRYFDVNRSIPYFYRKVYANMIEGIEGNIGKKLLISQTDEGNSILDIDSIYAEDLDVWTIEKRKRENLFSYELILPNTFTKEQGLDYMKKDLDKYFKIQSKIERRKTKCLVLVKKGNGELLKYSSQEASTTDFILENNILYFKGCSINDLIERLNYFVTTSLPIIDETKICNNIQLTIPYGKIDVHEIRHSLQDAGLDLVETIREINYLVLYRN